MKLETLSRVTCYCGGGLRCESKGKNSGSAGDVTSSKVLCADCPLEYPIIGGVLILVPDAETYIAQHLKGILSHVTRGEVFEVITDELKDWIDDALKEMAIDSPEHIDEDLESDRVNALYLMTHYLSASEIQSDDALMKNLIAQYWDQGPMTWVETQMKKFQPKAVLEIGAGVGGMLRRAGRAGATEYLGIDSSFSSVFWARKMMLAVGDTTIQVPDDLIRGPLSRACIVPAGPKNLIYADFIVMEMDVVNLQDQPVFPVKRGAFDCSLSMNLIDMLNRPDALAQIQFEVLKPGGHAIMTSPYVWHEKIAAHLKGEDSAVVLSADVAAKLFVNAGCTTVTEDRHIPWVFFKNARQLEVYSVHGWVGCRV